MGSSDFAVVPHLVLLDLSLCRCPLPGAPVSFTDTFIYWKLKLCLVGSQII